MDEVFSAEGASSFVNERNETDYQIKKARRIWRASPNSRAACGVLTVREHRKSRRDNITLGASGQGRDSIFVTRFVVHFMDNVIVRGGCWSRARGVSGGVSCVMGFRRRIFSASVCF